jgi:hypothetical protein
VTLLMSAVPPDKAVPMCAVFDVALARATQLRSAATVGALYLDYPYPYLDYPYLDSDYPYLDYAQPYSVP